MRQTVPVWTVPLTAILGLAVGVLLNAGSPPRQPATDPGEASGLVLVIRADSSLATLAEFSGAALGPDGFRHTYTFRRPNDAQRAGKAARAALLAEFGRALRGE